MRLNTANGVGLTVGCLQSLWDSAIVIGHKLPNVGEDPAPIQKVRPRFQRSHQPLDCHPQFPV